MAAEGQQPRLVALHEGLERAVLTAPDERHQLLVGLEPQQGRSPRESRQRCLMSESGSFQGYPRIRALPERHGSTGKVAPQGAPRLMFARVMER